MVFAFDECRLDVERRELRRGAALVEVEPRVFDVLVYLLRHRNRVVSKDDLLQAVWAGRIVSDSALTTRINAVRRAVGDTGAAQRLIRTFARKGVRFIGEVREISDSVPTIVSPMTGSAEARQEALSIPDKPSIAVLPFQNMSGDPEQEYFADGMVEEIITALSRIRWLFVIARNSSFTYRGQAFDVKRVGRELGVRYVLEGSVRKAGNRVRITAQLVEAETGAQLWADRFDGLLEDVFDLQDQVATAVAGVIEPELQAAETARSAGRPTVDLTAYDLYLRAYATFWSSASRIPEALRLSEQAIARDPNYGPALAWATICCFRIIGDGRSENPAADRAKGIDFARRALEVGGNDPAVLVNVALALTYFGEDVGATIGLVDRALALNPNFARGWRISGNLRLRAGQLDTAIEHVETSLRLSPRTPIGAPLVGYALFLSRRFDEALPKLLLAIQEDPSATHPYRYLAACYAHMGRLDDARKVISRLRAITSNVLPVVLFDRKPEHRELLLSGLRLAMGETVSARQGRVLRRSARSRRAGGR